MEKGNNKNAILLTVIGIATLLVAIVGATFAYFSAQVTYNDTNSTLTIVSASGGTSKYEGGDEIRIENIYPRDEAWVQKAINITYKNSTTNLPYKYVLTLNYASTFTDNYLTYKFEPITSGDGICLSDGSKKTQTDCGKELIKSTNNGTPIAVKEGSLMNTDGAAANPGITLGTGTFQPTTGEETAAHVYLLTIWFKNGTGNQNDAQGKALTASVNYAEDHS